MGKKNSCAFDFRFGMFLGIVFSIFVALILFSVFLDANIIISKIEYYNDVAQKECPLKTYYDYSTTTIYVPIELNVEKYICERAGQAIEQSEAKWTKIGVFWDDDECILTYSETKEIYENFAIGIYDPTDSKEPFVCFGDEVQRASECKSQICYNPSDWQGSSCFCAVQRFTPEEFSR